MYVLGSSYNLLKTETSPVLDFLHPGQVLPLLFHAYIQLKAREIYIFYVLGYRPSILFSWILFHVILVLFQFPEEFLFVAHVVQNILSFSYNTKTQLFKMKIYDIFLCRFCTCLLRYSLCFVWNLHSLHFKNSISDNVLCTRICLFKTYICLHW